MALGMMSPHPFFTWPLGGTLTITCPKLQCWAGGTAQCWPQSQGHPEQFPPKFPALLPAPLTLIQPCHPPRLTQPSAQPQHLSKARRGSNEA